MRKNKKDERKISRKVRKRSGNLKQMKMEEILNKENNRKSQITNKNQEKRKTTRRKKRRTKG